MHACISFSLSSNLYILVLLCVSNFASLSNWYTSRSRLCCSALRKRHATLSIELCRCCCTVSYIWVCIYMQIKKKQPRRRTGSKKEEDAYAERERIRWGCMHGKIKLAGRDVILARLNQRVEPLGPGAQAFWLNRANIPWLGRRFIDRQWIVARTR